MAAAITEHFSKEKAIGELTGFKTFTGKGVMAEYKGEQYAIGNIKWLKTLGITIEQHLSQSADELLEQGNIVVYMSKGEEVVGIVSIADKLRATSKAAIAQLNKMGIAVHMLTGDQEKTASNIAKKVGITHFRSGLLPQDKGQYIKNCRKPDTR